MKKDNKNSKPLNFASPEHSRHTWWVYIGYPDIPEAVYKYYPGLQVGIVNSLRISGNTEGSLWVSQFVAKLLPSDNYCEQPYMHFL